MFRATILALVLAGEAALGDVGMLRIEVEAPHRDSAISGAIWYPTRDTASPERITFANPAFQGVPAREGAEPLAGSHPVVLLSHGLGGNIRTLAWLATGLAEDGAVVISLNHPGSTTRDVDMAHALDHPSRAADMTAALDWLGAEFQIDETRIMAAGFSLGGFTALTLGGLRGDLDAYADHCDAYGDRSTHCADLARWGLDLRALDAALWSAEMSDPRITHVAAIDPGLSFGIDPASAEAFAPEALLVTLGDADTRLAATDISDAGSGLASAMPGSQWQVITPGSHFSMMPECKRLGPLILRIEGAPPICTPAAGEIRAETHAAIIAALSAHMGL